MAFHNRHLSFWIKKLGIRKIRCQLEIILDVYILQVIVPNITHGSGPNEGTDNGFSGAAKTAPRAADREGGLVLHERDLRNGLGEVYPGEG